MAHRTPTTAMTATTIQATEAMRPMTIFSSSHAAMARTTTAIARRASDGPLALVSSMAPSVLGRGAGLLVRVELAGAGALPAFNFVGGRLGGGPADVAVAARA